MWWGDRPNKGKGVDANRHSQLRKSEIQMLTSARQELEGRKGHLLGEREAKESGRGRRNPRIAE